MAKCSVYEANKYLKYAILYCALHSTVRTYTSRVDGPSPMESTNYTLISSTFLLQLEGHNFQTLHPWARKSSTPPLGLFLSV